jgi:hypothetical protein
MNSFRFVLAIGVSFLALYQAFAHEDKNVSGGDGIDQGFVRQEKKTMTDNVNRKAQGNKFAAGGVFWQVWGGC